MAEQNITLEPSESRVINFEATPDVAKTYSVTVDGLAGSFRAIMVRTTLSVSAEPIELEYERGETTKTIVHILNTGSVTATGIKLHLIIYDSNGDVWKDWGWYNVPAGVEPGTEYGIRYHQVLVSTDPLGQYTYKAWAKADNADEVLATGNTFKVPTPPPPPPVCTIGATKCEGYNLYECQSVSGVAQWVLIEENSPECGYTPPTGLIGDLNDDGVVNILDLVLLQRYIAGMSVSTPLSDAEFRRRADVNGDGRVNSLDITAIERLIAGL